MKTLFDQTKQEDFCYKCTKNPPLVKKKCQMNIMDNEMLACIK